MNKRSLIALAILLGLLGGITSYASGRIICIMDYCILVTEGEGFNARGFEINAGQAKLLQQLPIVFWGLGGALLVGGLVQAEKST